MDLRYAVTTNTGEEKIITWEHKLKPLFSGSKAKSHHAGKNTRTTWSISRDSLGEGRRRLLPDMKEGIRTIALMKAMEGIPGHGSAG